MVRCKRVLRQLAWLLSFFWLSLPAFGHALKFGSVTLIEMDSGYWQVNFRYSGNEKSLAGVKLQIADNCQTRSALHEREWPYGRGLDWQIQCSAPTLPQWVEVTGVQASDVQILFHVQPRQGKELKTLMTGSELHLSLMPYLAEPSMMSDTPVVAYLTLGIKHILQGLDHLAFVLLMLLFAVRRSTLVWIISAFTLGHTVTLILSGMGILAFNPAVTEVLIALSIVLLAAERLRSWRSKAKTVTLTLRYPALAAFLFGWVHGMGFASVLSEIGLPKVQQVPALLLFNVGVEIGQLLFVVVCVYVIRVMKSLHLPFPKQIPVYGIGCTGAFFMFARLLD